MQTIGDVLPAVRERLLPQLDHTLQCWRDLAAQEEAAPGPTPAAQAVPAAAEPIISVAVGSSAVGTIPGASAAVAAVAAVATAVATAFFMVNTLMPVVRPENFRAAHGGGSQLPGGSSRAAAAQKNYFVLFAGALQFALLWYLSGSARG